MRAFTQALNIETVQDFRRVPLVTAAEKLTINGYTCYRERVCIKMEKGGRRLWLHPRAARPRASVCAGHPNAAREFSPPPGAGTRFRAKSLDKSGWDRPENEPQISEHMRRPRLLQSTINDVGSSERLFADPPTESGKSREEERRLVARASWSLAIR